MTEVKAPSVFLTQSSHSVNVVLPSLSFSNDTSFRRPFLIALSKKDSPSQSSHAVLLDCNEHRNQLGVMLSQILTRGLGWGLRVCISHSSQAAATLQGPDGPHSGLAREPFKHFVSVLVTFCVLASLFRNKWLQSVSSLRAGFLVP